VLGSARQPKFAGAWWPVGGAPSWKARSLSEGSLSHRGAIVACRCPTTFRGSPARLKSNAPASAIPAWGERARVRPKLRARGGRQGPRTSRPEMALSVPSPHPPCTAPWGPRCNNVVIGARSQVGLIRHADQEITVRSSSDRSSPYWVTPERGGTQNHGCRFRSHLPHDRCQSLRSTIPGAGDDLPAMTLERPCGSTRLGWVLPSISSTLT
jgi:hypothetical protein